MVGFAASAPGCTPRLALWRFKEKPNTVRLTLFAALFALSLVPVLTTPIPAMVDYVNHLSRMYELAAQGTPQASPFYHTAWKLYPNLAMDLVVPLLARWTGVEQAARLFLLASQMLVVTGSVAIELRVKGRFAISGFVAVLFLFNVPFAWGFLNFEFALGIALWGIAAWLTVRAGPWPVRLGVHALFAVLLFAAHLFALGLYGATLCLHEGWAAPREGRSLRRTLAAALLLGTPALALVLLMMMTAGTVGGSVNLWQGFAKPAWLLLLLNGDNAVVSVLGTILFLAILASMARQGELGFQSSGAWLAAGFAALYVVVPGRLLDTAFADIRVLVGAVLILPAFVTVTFADTRREHLAAAIMAVLTLINVTCVERVWQSYQPVYRDMIASFARLKPHARVLIVHGNDADDPPLTDLAVYPLYHAPTLATHYAGAFVPTLFTSVGKQPLAISSEMERLSFSCGGPVPLAVLRAIASKGPKTAQGQRFIEDWTHDFDYVYVLEPPVEDPMPGILHLVVRHARFALYRVRSEANHRTAVLSVPALP